MFIACLAPTPQFTRKRYLKPRAGTLQSCQILPHEADLPFVHPVQGWQLLLHCTLLSVHNPQRISWELAGVSRIWDSQTGPFRSQHRGNSLASPTAFPTDCPAGSHCEGLMTDPLGLKKRDQDRKHIFHAVQKPEGSAAHKDQPSCIHSFYAIPSFMLWSVCHIQWITTRKSN